MDVYRDLAMRPLLVRREIEGFLSDRLQEAMWREILHLVADGVATTGELDDAIVYGPGLRWAVMGTNLTFHLAGGEAGMRHMLEQFGPALDWPWTKLQAPPLTDELIDRMVAGTADQAAGRDVFELERLRDDALVAVMYALRQTGLGAGDVINQRRTVDQDPIWTPGSAVSCPLPARCRPDPDCWGNPDRVNPATHVNALAGATESFISYIGGTGVTRDTGCSFATAENHLVYHRRQLGGAPLRCTTQLLGYDDQRLHLFHAMYDHAGGDLLCTSEQIVILTGPAGNRVTIPHGPRTALEAIWESHRHAPRPERVVMTMTR